MKQSLRNLFKQKRRGPVPETSAGDLSSPPSPYATWFDAGGLRVTFASVVRLGLGREF